MSIVAMFALTLYRYTTLQDPLDRFNESPLMTRRRVLLVVYSILFSQGLFGNQLKVAWS